MKRCPQLIVLYLIVTIFFYSVQLKSQTVTKPEKRIALVIGNGNYSAGMPLANPENDARSMTDVLKKLDFTVLKYENLSAGQMKKAIPVDAQLKTEEQVEYDCVRADRVMALMETSGTTINIVILDACRNNPFERSWTRSTSGRGLTLMNAPNGTVIAFSTAPEKTALDGSGKNSPYTSALLESLLKQDLSITQVFQNVNKIVTTQSNKQQTPWYSSSLSDDFYFNQFEKNNQTITNNAANTANSGKEQIVNQMTAINNVEQSKDILKTNPLLSFNELKATSEVKISFDLEGRSAVELAKPVKSYFGEETIIFPIMVSWDGSVIVRKKMVEGKMYYLKTGLNVSNSKDLITEVIEVTSLLELVEEAAKSSKFNVINKSPFPQVGSITYDFKMKPKENQADSTSYINVKNISLHNPHYDTIWRNFENSNYNFKGLVKSITESDERLSFVIRKKNKKVESVNHRIQNMYKFDTLGFIQSEHSERIDGGIPITEADVLFKRISFDTCKTNSTFICIVNDSLLTNNSHFYIIRNSKINEAPRRKQRGILKQNQLVTLMQN
jgi:hypothetical protein